MGAHERRTRDPGRHQRRHGALGDDDEFRADPRVGPPKVCSTASPITFVAWCRHRRLAGHRQHRDAGDGSSIARFLVDAGWSKDDARADCFRLKAGERPVRIGRPEGILIVGAGGPGMSETWVLFPHLATAYHLSGRTRTRHPGIGRDRSPMSLTGLDPTSGLMPESSPGEATRTSSLAGAVVGIVSNGLGESDRILQAVYRELAAAEAPSARCSCASPACRCRPTRWTGEAHLPGHRRVGRVRG